MIRRNFIKGMTLSSTSMAFGNVVNPQWPSKSNKPLQMVHMTDTHVFKDKDCPKYMELFLDEIERIAPNPDLIFHTGDVIMDALFTNDRSYVLEQWKLWHALADRLPVKVDYAIGNHDIWGQGPKNDNMYGKKWAMAEIELDQRYYSFSRGDWNIRLGQKREQPLVRFRWIDAFR